MLGPVTSDIKTLAVCTAVLYVKFRATTMIQGRLSFRAGSRVQEDTGLLFSRSMPKQQSYESAKEVPAHLKAAYMLEARWKRIVQNDLESIPIAIAVFMVAIVAGGIPELNSNLLIGYTFARVAHTYTYAKQLQPHRMFAWFGGVFCVAAAAANGVYGAMKAPLLDDDLENFRIPGVLV